MRQQALRPTVAPNTGIFSGFGVIFRKEIQESNPSRRTAFSILTSTALTAVGPIGYWMYHGGLHKGKVPLTGTSYDTIVTVPGLVPSSLGFFIVIALTMGIIVREEDLGTLQWVFTKPLSRVGLVMAKWLSSRLMTIFSIIIIPSIITFGLIEAMFGLHDRSNVMKGMVGSAVLYVFQCALSCGISGIFSSTTAVAGISFALFFSPTLLSAHFHDWARLVPTQITNVANNAVTGEALTKWDYATIASTVVTTILLIVLAARRLSKREFR